MAGPQQLNTAYLASFWHQDANFLRPHRIIGAHPSAMSIGVGVIEDVDCESRLSFPRNTLHESIAAHAHRRLAT